MSGYKYYQKCCILRGKEVVVDHSCNSRLTGKQTHEEKKIIERAHSLYNWLKSNGVIYHGGIPKSLIEVLLWFHSKPTYPEVPPEEYETFMKWMKPELNG